MKSTLSLLFIIISLTALLSGCRYNEPDQPPCAEAIPCQNAPADPCPNITSGRWTSLGLENESVGAIAVHPCNPGIIYAGTQFNFSAGVQGKLFKTADCGQNWDTLAVGGSYRTIQLSPGNPDVVYAAYGGILKSTNAGQSWQRVDKGISLDAETSIPSLAINPKNACELYAGTGGFFGGDLYKSTDAGASWQRVFDLEVTAIAIDPLDPANVYVGSNGGVLRSTDGGERWKPTGLNTGSLVDILKIADDSRRMYAGIRFEGFFFVRLDTYLNTWGQITENVEGDDFSTKTLVISPQKNSVMYVTIKQLAYQSEDSGKNWRKLVEIDSLNRIQVLTIEPDGNFLFGSSPDKGLTIIKIN